MSPYGQVLGTVTLKYSNSCGTNWAKVQNNSSYSQIKTWATRPNYDGATTIGHGGDPGPYYGSSAYSTQLYGNGYVVCAWGELLYTPIQGNPIPVNNKFCA